MRGPGDLATAWALLGRAFGPTTPVEDVAVELALVDPGRFDGLLDDARMVGRRRSCCGRTDLGAACLGGTPLRSRPVEERTAGPLDVIRTAFGPLGPAPWCAQVLSRPLGRGLRPAGRPGTRTGCARP